LQLFRKFWKIVCYHIAKPIRITENLKIHIHFLIVFKKTFLFIANVLEKVKK